MAFEKVRNFIQILPIFLIVCSCGHKNRNHEGYDGKGNTSAKEKMQGRNDCSWDTDSLDGKKVFTLVDKMPAYKGGMNNYFDLIGKEMRIPQDQRMWQSIVVVFIVDTLGQVRNECLLNKSSMDSLTVVEKEALKAVRNHQDWIPGYHNGKKVAVKLVLPLTVGHRG
jgi:hypothetical protein